MSNAGRPRTGMKPCQHCGSTDRDSNGQCHCRNVAYREARKAALKGKQNKKIEKTLATSKKAKAKADTKKAKADKVSVEPTTKPTPERYILVVDGFEETPYARKDAAIKNGVRSGMEWTVTYKGKTVATSEV